MANPEYSPIQQKTAERKQPTPLEIATEVTNICDQLSSITDFEKASALQEKLLALTEEHAQGTSFVIQGVRRDLPLYGNKPGQRPIEGFSDHLEIDLDKDEYGIFSPEGAQKFERNQLSFLIPGELSPRHGFPSSDTRELKELHSSWSKAYEDYYGEPAKKEKVILFNSRPSYGK